MGLVTNSARHARQAAIAAFSCQDSMELIVGGSPPVKVVRLERRFHGTRFRAQPAKDFVLGCRRGLQCKNLGRHPLQRDGEFIDFSNIGRGDCANKNSLSRLNRHKPLGLQTDCGFVHRSATHPELRRDVALRGLIARRECITQDRGLKRDIGAFHQGSLGSRAGCRVAFQNQGGQRHYLSSNLGDVRCIMPPVDNRTTRRQACMQACIQ